MRKTKIILAMNTHTTRKELHINAIHLFTSLLSLPPLSHSILNGF